MRKVKDAVDLTTNEKIYFKGHAKATYLSDGRNVEEAINEMPNGESSVFEAVYGTTTYEEIVAAFNEKKHVLCLWNDRVYNLSAVTANLLNFSCVKDSVIYIASCKADNTWGDLQYNVEHVRNKATSLTSAATDAQYPSAKAVYDFVSNTLGTIINGDY